MSTTTSHSNNFQIKLIGTGREAGTWGDSMNENLQRLEAAMGRAVSINIESMPLGSTNAEAGNSWNAIWLTVDTADSGGSESGSEGRSKIVEVTDSGTLGSAPTLDIRGSASGEVPARLILIKNALTSHDLTIDGGTATDVVVRRNNWALLALVPSTVGGIGAGVHNMLSDTIQMGDINFDGSTQLSFNSGSNSIQVPTSQASALMIDDGTNDFLRFDSASVVMDVFQNIESGDKDDMRWLFRDSTNTGFSFYDKGGLRYMTFDSTDENVEFVVPVHFRTTDLDTTNQNTTISMRDNAGQSLVFDAGVGGTEILRLDTSNAAERVRMGVPATVPDIQITGSDGYIEFNSGNFDGTGYGIRDNSGNLELKDSTEDWGRPYHSNMTSGNGAFFQSSVNLGSVASGSLTNDFSASEAHSLGSTPKIVRCVLRCISADNSYSIGDEIDISTLQDLDEASGPSTDNVTYGANSTNVFVHCSNLSDLRMIVSGGGSGGDVTLSRWDIYIYAWK